jgi:hypothetical protein
MLRKFIHGIIHSDIKRSQHSMEKLVLLAKTQLLDFYVNAGFHVVQPSSITHGQDHWFELEMNLYANSDD